MKLRAIRSERLRRMRTLVYLRELYWECPWTVFFRRKGRWKA
jgi:hypothetical protein